MLNFSQTRERCSTSTANIGMWDNFDLSLVHIYEKCMP